MSRILVPGPLSGRNYRVRIAGDAPTADERQEIDAFVRQQEQAFAAQYQERFGENLLPGRGLGAQVGDFFRGIPRGVGGIFEGAATGAVTPFSEETELGLREGIRGLGQSWQDRFAPRIGQEDMVGGRLGEAVGSMLGIAGVGAGTTLATAPLVGPAAPFLGFGAAAGVGAAAGAGEASERARAADATQEERNLATRLGLIPGALEVVPLVRLSRVLERGGLRERLVRAAITGGEEAAQEAASNIAQNLIEQGVYNPEQGTFTDTGEALGYGFGAGALVQAMMDLALPGRLRSRAGPGTPPAPPAPPTAPAGALPPGSGNAVFTGSTRVEETPDGTATIVQLRDGEEIFTITIPGRATQAQIDEAVRQYNAAQAPATPTAPSAVQINPDIAEAREFFEERAGIIQEGEGVSREQAEARAAQETLDRLQQEGKLDLAEPGSGLPPLVRGLRNVAARAEPVDTGAPTPPVEAYAAELAGDTRQGALDLAAASEARLRGAPSAQTQEAPVAPVDRRTGISSQDRVIQPSRGDVAAPAPRADTPDAGASLTQAMGETVSGAPAVDVPAAAQPDTLTQQGLASTPPSTLEATPPVPSSSAVPGETGVAGQWDALTNAQKQGVAAELGVPVSRVPERIASDPEAVNNAIEDFFAPLGDTRTRVDPRTLRPVGPRITATPPVDQAPSRVADAIRSEVEAQRAAQIDAIAAQVEVREDARAKAAIAGWFDENAPREVRRAFEAVANVAGVETATLRSADVAPLLQLLSTAPTPTAVNAATPAAMAYQYFSRHRDPGMALHAIAHDAAQAKAYAAVKGDGVNAEDYIPSTWRKDSILNRRSTSKLSEGKVTLLTEAENPRILKVQQELVRQEGLGRTPGERALQWVQENLSPETAQDTVAMRDRPASAESAGYKWRSTIRNIERRNENRVLETPDERENRLRDEKERAAGLERRGRTRAQVEQEARTTEAAQDRNLRRQLDAEAREARRVFARDAEKARADRGLTRQQWEALPVEQQVELVQDYRDLQRVAQLERLGISPSYTWPVSAHPHVGALIRSGDFGSAVSMLALTAPGRYLKRLARAIQARVENVRSRAVPAAELARIRDTLSPETPTLGQRPAATYIWPMSPEGIQQLRDNGHNEAADITAEYGGQVIFDESVPMSAELVLHEAVHVAADAVLDNPSHPLTRRLENLRRDLLKTMPATEYGLLNVKELLSEGLTNPVFRRDLSYLTTEGTTRTARERFMDALRGFMRSLMGLPPRKSGDVRSARDLVDQTLDDILALDPNDASPTDVIGASFRFMQGARDTLDTFRDRARVPDAADIAQMRQMVTDASVPRGFKSAFMSLFMPLRYVADGAKSYGLPSADLVNETMSQHKSAREAIEDKVRNSGKVIEDLVRPHLRDDAQMELLTRVVYEPQEFNIDPRAQDGNVRYKDDPEKLEAWRRYNPMWNQMNADMQKAANSIWAVHRNVVRPALQDGVKANLEAIAPNKKPLTDRIFKDVYQKLFAEATDVPHAPLTREGTYWLSYGAADPQSGQFKYRKHSFVTADQLAAAIRKLEALNEAATAAGNPPVVTELNPYRNVPGNTVRPKESLDMIARILATVEGFGELTSITDPVTGETKDVRQDIINMVFDSLPESSFVQSFRQRKFTPGYDGDFTPLTEGVVPGDVVGNNMKAALARTQQAVDLEYGARFSSIREQLRKEFRAYQNSVPAGKDPVRHARDVDTASVYLDQLVEATRAPFMQRAGWSGSSTGGAYMLTLGFNASTALLTLTSLPLFAASILSGRYSLSDIVAAMGTAHRLITASGRFRQAERVNDQGQIETFSKNVGMFNFSGRNYDATRPENRWMAIPQAIGDKNAVFYNSLVQDVLLGENPNIIQKFAGHSSILQHTAERYSREVSYWSAYFLELRRLAGNSLPYRQFVEGVRDGSIQIDEAVQTEAAKNSVEIAERANGPMFAAAGPSASRGDIGSVMYLFKRHPLSMLNLMLQTAYKSTPWGSPIDSADPATRAQQIADRKMFQRQAVAMYGMMGLMAGAMGLPLMQQIGWLYDLFADDDEPSFAAQMRIVLGEAGSLGLVNWFTNQNVAPRIGLGDAIYRPASVADQLPPMWRFAEGIGGPVVGLLGKYTNRVPNLLNQGEYWRAAESAMPTAFGNIMRAARFGQEGVLTMRGDAIVSEVGPYSVMAQAMGFMSAEYAQQLSINAERTRINNAIMQRRSRLLQQLNRAINENDWPRERSIREQIDEFNRRNPDNPIETATEARSMRGYLQTRAQMEYGVNITPANRQRIDEMLRYGRAWAGQ